MRQSFYKSHFQVTLTTAVDWKHGYFVTTSISNDLRGLLADQL